MAQSYLLAVDQGTSSSRAILFDLDGRIVATKQKSHDLIYPKSGWVEQNPHDILNNTIEVVQKISSESNVTSKNLSAIGIANQRETVVVWDRVSGEPVYNAIVWQDRRTSDYCKNLKDEGFDELVSKKTGLILDPYFSATKIKWILDNVDGARNRAERGELIFGTIDCFLLWHFTKGEMHMTDSTNASRTMLCNIETGQWDNELFDLFGIPRFMPPIIRDNISDYGLLKIESDVDGAPICGMAGDQQAALIGQGCVAKGMVKSTYGTGCFVLMNTGRERIFSTNKMLSTIAYSINGEITYALEGSIFNAGTAVQFLRDNLNFFESSSETELMANELTNNGGVYFIPAFTGLGAPYWNPDARGAIMGIERDTKKEHIVRAALEAQAYQSRDLLQAMESDAAQNVEVIRADGGLVANEFMCQFLSDQLKVPIEVPEVIEATAWGVAVLAGIGAGVLPSLDEVSKNWCASRRYEPIADNAHTDALYAQWCDIVKRLTCVV